MTTLDEWYATASDFEYRGHRIVWRDSGESGPWLILIHGFPTASWDWHRIWDALAQNYRLLAFDMIGFGYSAKPRNYDYSILDQADLTEALVRHVGLDHCHVLPHDYGDTVAQELLARQNDKRIVLFQYDIHGCSVALAFHK